MKTTYRLFIGAAALTMSSIALTSCDEVAEDDRYILGEAVVAERAILLEDFTGQSCVNCPAAHEVIEQLEEQFGKDKVIAVSIHSGSFGLSTKATNFARNRVGLMTEEGNAIMESYGITQFPMGVINMTGDAVNYTLWATKVRDALKVTTDVNIELEANYIPDANDGEDGYFGTIEAKATVMSNTARTVNFQFWILEDNIVAQQSNGNIVVQDYVHNNVFRAQVFDGLKGQPYSLTAGFEQEITGAIATRWTNKEHWELENLSVVAFASDASGVLQVVKVPLFKDDTEEGEETETEE